MMFKDTITSSKHINKRMLLEPDRVPDFERAKEVLQDLRIRRAMHPFQVALVDYNDECLELELFIEENSIAGVRNKTASRISSSSNERVSADYQSSWSRINLIPQHEDCMRVEVFYKRFIGVVGKVAMPWLGDCHKRTTLGDVISGAVEVVVKAPVY